MLRLGPHIRLTQAEIDYLTHITGFAPGPIRRLDDLHRYINKCKRHYWGTSRATRTLHRMIDDAYLGCLEGHQLAAV
ncbi:hypothetical protein [Pseudoduganella sp. UC29_71]|uniref:hypothetical protein n=1 Tax=Pseudoduganella sp. UC29_71 TaxID=3350174 RepID=UPI00366E0CBA